jgi:thiopurine S-methyltransferase
MDKPFWEERWQAQQIGFHEGKPNELLAQHADRLGRGTRVLVPLAGKAFDLRWLAERGHRVVGVEFVAEAIAAFHREQGEVHGVTLVQGDFFTVEGLGSFDVIYDRAALVALDPATRERYVARCRSLSSGGIFLIAFAYDQTKAPGPPWSVDEAAVRALYGGRIDVLARRALPTSTRLKDAGVDAIEETAYWIYG